jgi:hypothetical protein
MRSLVAILLGRAPTPAKAAHLAERYCVCPYCVLLTTADDTIIGLYSIPPDRRWWLEWIVDHPQETLGLEGAELFFAQQIEVGNAWSPGAVKAEHDRAPCGADCPACTLYQQKCEGCPATKHYRRDRS